MMENEAENKRENDTRDEDNLSYLMKTGGVISQSAGETIHCLTIIGQIEGHYLLGEGQKVTKYEHLIPLLVSIEESDEIDGLLLVLNTMGGDVEAGLALSEMIASMQKPTVSLVLGGGHSIGVPLAAFPGIPRTMWRLVSRTKHACRAGVRRWSARHDRHSDWKYTRRPGSGQTKMPPYPCIRPGLHALQHTFLRFPSFGNRQRIPRITRIFALPP